MESSRQLPLELLDNIRDNLTPVGLDSLSRTSHDFREATRVYKDRVLSVKSAYRGIFDDNTELGDFQDLQGRCGLLVSGSTALSFFNHCSYAGDLDTYCQFERSMMVGEWFLSHGFAFAPSFGQANDYFVDVERVRTLRRDTPQAVALQVDSDIREYKLNNIAVVWNFKRRLLKAQLMATIGSPLETILSFHSTCVMNIFTHRSAYCLFPQLTLEEKKTMLINIQLPLTEVQANALSKYERRGFKIVHQPPLRSVVNEASSLTFLRPRFVGDSHCYKVPFEHVGKGEVKPDFVEANSWGITYLRKFNTMYFGSVDLPEPLPSYVAFKDDLATINRHLRSQDQHIADGLVDYESSLLTIQTLLKPNHHRPVNGRARLLTLAHIVEIVQSHNCVSYSCAVVQEIYEYLCIVDSLAVVPPIVDCFLSRNNDSTVLHIDINVSQAKPRVDWDEMKQRARALIEDKVFIKLICVFL
ncbi:hypothetical protein C8J55DRAFT_563092 [Lentinula edodes]|uniref:F-box domain-containing protein n=1 Tax=Lentinula lateritia TaxID=40482 RepID=A0A9W9A2B5_9AGAR|nr:hypothetical protein C8J55DRAFT_563092 [Lentinula edodes]